MKAVNAELQTTLFQDAVVRPNESSANPAGFDDPSFAVNKESPVHRWVPWIAGFSRSFVSGAIKRHLSRPGTILDPFAGVGTTLVEGVLAGHNTIGFEINPYAAFACRCKLSSHLVDVKRLRSKILEFEDFYGHASQNGYRPRSTAPEGFATRAAFYSPKVLFKVLIILDFVTAQSPGPVRDLMALAFASTMVTYSNYSYEPSLGRRVAAGKQDILDFSVGETVAGKLRQIADDISWTRVELGSRLPQTAVHNESFFKLRERLSASSVDLIITSPPYLNNYHYNRNTRPHLYWLGYAASPSDFVKLEHENFGKYWQTVREIERLDLDFPQPPSDLVQCLELIRQQKPEKGVYGGNGWANYAAAYFNDCYRFARATKWALRRNGTALVVIGNNILQGVMIPTDQYLARISDQIGLKVVDIHIPRTTRVGNSIIQSGVRVGKAKQSDSLYEAVVELRKR